MRFQTMLFHFLLQQLNLFANNNAALAADQCHARCALRVQCEIHKWVEAISDLRCGQAKSRKRMRASAFLAGQMENHGHVHAVLAPGPGFRDVFGIFKADHQMMLVARGW